MAQPVARNRLPEAFDVLQRILILCDGDPYDQGCHTAGGGLHDATDFRVDTVIGLLSFLDRRVPACLPPMYCSRSLVEVTLGDGVIQTENGFEGQAAKDPLHLPPGHAFGLDRTVQIKPYLRRNELSFIRYGHQSTNSPSKLS